MFERVTEWLKRKLKEKLKKYLPWLWRTTLTGAFMYTVYNADGSVAAQGPITFNGDTTAGLNDMLSVYFNSGTQKTLWYLGLISNTGFSALAAADTSASHAGWTEAVPYSNVTRPQWTPNAPSNGIITGSSVSFTINATHDVKGAFIISENTKSGATGVLFATGTFSSVQSLTSGQTFTITYQKTFTAS